jgi:hypothetical protein
MRHTLKDMLKRGFVGAPSASAIERRQKRLRKLQVQLPEMSGCQDRRCRTLVYSGGQCWAVKRLRVEHCKVR